MTKYEKAIYQLIITTKGHMTADEIYKRIKADFPGVSLATIYNNLNRLCDDEMIKRLRVEGSPDRFDEVRRHDHIICPRCGKISDLDLFDLSEKLKDELGDIVGYELKVFKICDDCKDI